MIDTIFMNLPFMVLSTKINGMGETEKRILTPFGTIDITFRVVSDHQEAMPHFEVDVEGDTDHWIFYDHAIPDFRFALLDFIQGIVERHLDEEGPEQGVKELFVHVKGASTDMIIPLQSCTRPELSQEFSRMSSLSMESK